MQQAIIALQNNNNTVPWTIIGNRKPSKQALDGLFRRH
jgi:hypothetical protein